MPGHQEPNTPVWMYPSQQMFYNAMRRKGWNPSEDDMQAVVAIHNGVNERAWSEVGLLQHRLVSMLYIALPPARSDQSCNCRTCQFTDPGCVPAGGAVGAAAQQGMSQPKAEELCRQATGLQPQSTAAQFPGLQAAV